MKINMKPAIRPGCEVMGARFMISDAAMLRTEEDEGFLKFMTERLNEELMNGIWKKVEEGPIAICCLDDVVHNKDACDEMSNTLTRRIHYRPLVLCENCEYFMPECHRNGGICTKCKEYVHALDGCTHGSKKGELK